jgi:uncharacterized membrane protein YuzA (DUF378 family)
MGSTGAATPAGATITENLMKAINIVTLLLVIVGGLNWGLVGLFSFDLVAALFGSGSLLARIVYVLVGVSAAWQVVPLTKAISADETRALQGSSAR